MTSENSVGSRNLHVPASRIAAARKCTAWVNGKYPPVLFNHDIVEFRESKDGGIGLFAKTSIPKGQHLFSVPYVCMIEANNPSLKRSGFYKIAIDASERYECLRAHVKARKDRYFPLFMKEHCRDQVVIFLLLAVYRFLNMQEEESAVPEQVVSTVGVFRPYLDTLPKAFPEFITNWSAAEIQSLGETEHSTIHARMEIMVEHFDEMWRTCIIPALDAARLSSNNSSGRAVSMFMPHDNHSLRFIYNDALVIAMSRSHGSGGSCLVPLVDLINGARDGTVDASLILNHIDHIGSSVVTTNRIVEEGEELHIGYGAKSTAGYVMHYSFVPENGGMVNPHDGVYLCLRSNIVPKPDDVLRWRVLSLAGIEDWHLFAGVGFVCPFTLRADEVHSLRRGTIKSTDTRGFNFLRHVLTVIFENEEYSHAVIAGENPQPDQDNGVLKFMLFMFDTRLHNISRCTQSGTDAALTGNMLTARKALSAEYQLLLQWRHAVCIRFELDERQSASQFDLPEEEHCAVCNRSVKLKACSRCKAVKYCCVECQLEAWKGGHTKSCGKLL
jgi:hypothetical protein